MSDRGNWIQTFTGKRFYPLDVLPDDISIIDIAHALSLVNRFTGHTRQPYSVAEHSVRVAQLAPYHRPELRLAALLHDASEAYLADIARPIKLMSVMDSYRQLEHDIQSAIYRKFGITCDLAEVHQWDNILLATEGRDLMPGGTADWTLYGEPLKETIYPWTAGHAKEIFLRVYSECSRSLQMASM